MTLRLGIVGAGRIARAHAAATLTLDGVELVAVADVDAKTAADFAAEWGCSQSGTTVESILFDLDGLIVASPTSVHSEHALAALAAGVPVLIEKPFARNLEEARTVIQAGEAAGLPVVGAQVLRHLPIFTWAREQINAGVLGSPVQVIERRLVDRSDNFPWWADLPAFLVSHWGSHSIDLACDLLGERAVEVYCQSDSVRSDFGVVDDFGLQLRFGSGARAVSVMSFSSRLPVHDLVIIGTDATLSFECFRSASLNGETVLELPEQEMLDRGFAAQLADFAGALGGKPTIGAARSVLPALEALGAAERSALGAGLVRLDTASSSPA